MKSLFKTLLGFCLLLVLPALLAVVGVFCGILLQFFIIKIVYEFYFSKDEN